MTLPRRQFLRLAAAGAALPAVSRLAIAQAYPTRRGMGIWSTHVVNGAIYTLQYDLVKDFAPVTLISWELGTVIVARKATPAKDLRELIDWLKAGQGRATFGTAGVGSPPHIGGVLFQNLSGAPFQFVHYRGASQVAQDLVAGQIDMAIDSPTTSLPHVRAGLVKAYAVTAMSRIPAAPDIPTAD